MAETELAKGPKIVSWILQILVAVILGQTLFFKFMGAPESIYIFETLGAEPWGRFGSGAFELIAVILLLVPRLAVYGALLTIPLMLGAIGSHLTKLGIEVQGDGGLLFGLGLASFTSAVIIIVLRRRQLPIIGG